MGKGHVKEDPSPQLPSDTPMDSETVQTNEEVDKKRKRKHKKKQKTEETHNVDRVPLEEGGPIGTSTPENEDLDSSTRVEENADEIPRQVEVSKTYRRKKRVKVESSDSVEKVAEAVEDVLEASNCPVDDDNDDMSCKNLEKIDVEKENEVENAGPALDVAVEKDESGLLVIENEEDKPPSQILEASLESSLTPSSRKKLLILDVNGLLADIVNYDPGDSSFRKYKPSATIGVKAVFKRPFCDEFLKFCFERFDVGVWSSRTRRNVQEVIKFLMGDTRQKLLFCWDQSHCTDTGFYTIENREKPLVLKELKKLWEKEVPDLPWEKGYYNESNTLLLDDSPYKALRNPLYTAIFPHTYGYKDLKDKSLGPDGDLRIYLEGVAAAENVQKYVEQNPFGQRAITKSNVSWAFYLRVISSGSKQTGDHKIEDSRHREYHKIEDSRNREDYRREDSRHREDHKIEYSRNREDYRREDSRHREDYRREDSRHREDYRREYSRHDYSDRYSASRFR